MNTYTAEGASYRREQKRSGGGDVDEKERGSKGRPCLPSDHKRSKGRSDVPWKRKEPAGKKEPEEAVLG